MLREDSVEPRKGNLKSWNVSVANSTLIIIELEFDDSLYVSQGDQPDELLVQIKLQNFPDTLGQYLPDNILQIVDIPPQTSRSEARTFEKVGKTVS